MPIYEYACTSCGERTESKQGFTDPPLEQCSHCGGRLRKLYSPVGIVFKGSGFYSTDAKAKTAPAKSDKSKDDRSQKSETASDPARQSEPSKKEEKSA